MDTPDDKWSLHGLDENDPLRVKNADEALALISRCGFLPCFRNRVPGFSLEEHTLAADWWTGDEQRDPWEWRRLIAESRRAAYGKFFENKAGFISPEFLPLFAAWRRNGCDFDFLWEEGLVSAREKKIMDLFSERDEWSSPLLKHAAGFSKGGESGFEAALTRLQMHMFLTVKDFRRRIGKNGLPYGWAVGVYAAPEALWGQSAVTSACGEDRSVIKEKIMSKAKQFSSSVCDEDWERLLL